MPISLPPLEEYANIATSTEEYANIATSTGRVCQYRYLHWKSIPISIISLEEYVNIDISTGRVCQCLSTRPVESSEAAGVH
jgi:hypothetical protein